jgi:hypothetical protein
MQLVFYIGDARCAHGLEILTTVSAFSFFDSIIFSESAAAGKTNHGSTAAPWGTSWVHLCSLGGIVFYLAFRFATTKEFDSYTAQDWLDNKKWFDIKLLVDATRKNNVNHSKAMANNTYSDAVKATLKRLNIPSSQCVHLGRFLGPGWDIVTADI